MLDLYKRGGTNIQFLKTIALFNTTLFTLESLFNTEPGCKQYHRVIPAIQIITLSLYRDLLDTAPLASAPQSIHRSLAHRPGPPLHWPENFPGKILKKF